MPFVLGATFAARRWAARSPHLARQRDFAGYACARCGERGWARDDGFKAARPSPDRLAEIRRDAADREAAEQKERLRLALFLWSRRLPVEGTPAETYLREARGYSGAIPATLGYLPARGEHGHALIGAFGIAAELDPGVLAIANADVRGVHLTKLNQVGSDKADADEPKITVGKNVVWPIMLAPPNDLFGMAITEGIEDGLSVHQATGLGAWAAGSANRMPAIADSVPVYIECVTICAHPEPAGRASATKLAKALRARGIEAIIHGIAQ